MCESDVLSETGQCSNVTGITNNAVMDLPILVQAARLIQSSIGPIIGIFNQYASIGDGKSVHSCAQLQSFGTLIDDVAIACGGTQRIATPEGYIVHLSIRDGLAYMVMGPPSANDLERYPHVIFTSDDAWDPLLLDNEHALAPNVYHVDYSHGFQDHRINDFGEVIFDHQAHVEYCSVHRHDPHFKAMRPFLGWVNLERVKKTFENTTQWIVLRFACRFVITSRVAFLPQMFLACTKLLQRILSSRMFQLMMTVFSVMEALQWSKSSAAKTASLLVAIR